MKKRQKFFAFKKYRKILGKNIFLIFNIFVIQIFWCKIFQFCLNISVLRINIGDGFTHSFFSQIKTYPSKLTKIVGKSRKKGCFWAHFQRIALTAPRIGLWTLRKKTSLLLLEELSNDHTWVFRKCSQGHFFWRRWKLNFLRQIK